MEKGTLVEFRPRPDDDRYFLGVVQGPDGKKNWVLAIASGQTYSVAPRQITFKLSTQKTYTPQDLPGFSQRAETLFDPDSLAVAWELLQDEKRGLELKEIAQILFSEESPEALYATYKLLAEDRIYFKEKGSTYEPRPSQQVKENLHQLALIRQREQEQAEFEQHLQEALKSSSPWIWTPTERHRLESLERFAINGDNALDRDREQALKLLTVLNRSSSSSSAFSALVDLKVWSVHENLALRLTGIPTRFPSELETLAETLPENPPPDLVERRDLTHLHTYTIDDASTRDIDDALSIEDLDDGDYRLWIHIADPTRWIYPGHPLDLEARKRGTTVYLPEQVIPMFPHSLATGIMSLVQGEVRCALSFGIRLTPEGSVSECDIRPSLIKVTYRLTYEDADEMLELGAEQELERIAAAAQLRFRWRKSQDAINIGLAEQDIKVIDEVPYLRVIEDTPSRQLVAEMMVLTGEAVAAFASQRDIPIPYRYQAPPDLPPEEELGQLPQGPVKSFAIMRCMQRAEMTVTPGIHAGLGLAAYSQVTSPIRRYTDLVAHYQLKAFVSGSALPFSREELQQLIASLEPTQVEAVQLERKRKRYWTIEYLRTHSSRTWRALILGYLREHENLALIMIDEIAFRVPVRFARHVDLGEWVTLELTQADPRADSIDFREITSEIRTS